MKAKINLIVICILFCIPSSCTKTPNVSTEKKWFTEAIYSVSIYGWGPKEPKPLKNGPVSLLSEDIKMFQQILTASRSTKYNFIIPGSKELFANVKTEKQELELKISLSSIVDITNKRWYKVSNEQHIIWLINLVNSFVETSNNEEHDSR